MKEPKLILTSDLIQVVAEIDEFKGRWHALEGQNPERLNALRKIATIESIGSSTRIEGAQLTDGQVETLLAGLKTTSFQSRDEQEVAGYAEAMDLVFEAHEDLRLTENHIRQIHQTLLRHSAKDERHRGSYKTLPNHVVAFDADGKEIGVVFATTSPFDTPREMEELLAWTNKAIDEEAHHALLIISAFVVIFLAIHPFQDGNGRLSRVLTTLLLLRAGYSYVPFASLESVIEKNKELYYRALRRTQSTLSAEQPDWQPWLGFFLRSLKKQKNRLMIRLAEQQVSGIDGSQLPALAVRVLELIRGEGRQTIAQLTEATGANRNTLKVQLRKLVASSLIRQHGKARATWYSE
jgi:Fic family protein